MARSTDPSPPDDLDLEREIDRLFRLPLDGFVEARNALAATLRKSGRRDAAEATKALPKPSITAWAVNQVWWTDRRTFEAMLDAGTRLRDAQRASLQGQAGGLREAVEARQEAIAAVVDLATRAMGGADAVSAPMQQRLGATCDALATGDVPPGTRLGRLTTDLQPAGFGALSGMLGLAAMAAPAVAKPREPRTPATVTPFPARPLVPATPARTMVVESPQERRRREAEERTRAARERARQAVAEAERLVTGAEQARTARQSAVADADRRHEEARGRVLAAEQALERAREAEAEARITAGNARRDLAAADVELTRATRAAEKVRAHAAALDA